MRLFLDVEGLVTWYCDKGEADTLGQVLLECLIGIPCVDLDSFADRFRRPWV